MSRPPNKSSPLPTMSFAPRLQLACLLWPRSLGLRCLVAILLGVALGSLLPAVVPWLAPLRVVGLQASQLVVMPYLVCEVLHALGSLPAGALPVRLVLLIGRDDPNLADWVNGWLANQEAQGWAAAPLRALDSDARGWPEKLNLCTIGVWMIPSVSCHHPSATFCLCSHPSVFWPAQAMSRPGRCPRA